MKDRYKSKEIMLLLYTTEAGPTASTTHHYIIAKMLELRKCQGWKIVAVRERCDKMGLYSLEKRIPREDSVRCTNSDRGSFPEQEGQHPECIS